MHKEELHEDHSLDKVRADELHDLLAVEIPSDDEEGESQEVDQEL